MIRALALAAGAAAVLVGCTGSEQPPQAANAQAMREQGSARAEQLAEALLLADRAEHAGDAKALGKAALLIDRLGPHAQTESDAETLRRWRAALPADAPPPTRGRALGPGYRSAVLMPGATTQLNQTFLGGRSARIVVKIAEGSALKLMVRDQSELEVCRAERTPVNCRWVPLYTQRHNIKIVNTGGAMARFYIVFD
jgi:hypothetical protein